MKNLFQNNIFLWVLTICSVPVTYTLLKFLQSFDNVENPVFIIGILFSIAMTLLYSLKLIISKHVVKQDGVSINILIFFVSSFICLLLLPFISFESIASVDSKFWWIFIISSSFYYLSKFFNLKAITHGEISSVVLLHSITPIVIGIFGFFLLQELPNIYGVLGVVIIMVAIYFLKLEKGNKSFFDPIKSLFADRASWYMVVSISLIGVTTNLDKVGSQLASAFEWVFLSNLFLLVMSIPACYKSIQKHKPTIHDIRALYLVSLFAVFQLIFQMIAILNVLVVYVVTIKISSIIITIVIGGLFFKEENIRKKMLLGFFVVTGVILITLLG